MPSTFHFLVFFVITEYLFLQESSVPGESLLILVTVKLLRCIVNFITIEEHTVQLEKKVFAFR